MLQITEWDIHSFIDVSICLPVCLGFYYQRQPVNNCEFDQLILLLLFHRFVSKIKIHTTAIRRKLLCRHLQTNAFMVAPEIKMLIATSVDNSVSSLGQRNLCYNLWTVFN